MVRDRTSWHRVLGGAVALTLAGSCLLSAGPAAASSTHSHTAVSARKAKRTARTALDGYSTAVPRPGVYTVSLSVRRVTRPRATVDVYAEGQRVVTGLDVTTWPGAGSMASVRFPATVADGRLDLRATGAGAAVAVTALQVTLLSALAAPLAPAPASKPGAASSPVPAAAAAPSPGTRLPAPAAGAWPSGVWPGGALNAAAADAFGRFRGHRVDIATVYQVRDTWADLADNMWAVDQYAGWQGQLSVSVPLVPGDSRDAGSAAQIADVAAGRHDAEFRRLAQNLVARGRGSAIVRLGWEFNIPVYPWAATDATTWKAAFRRVVTTMRAVAPGLVIDWCGNSGLSQTGFDPFTSLYPGDDVVDIVGVDAYDNKWQVVRDEASWRTFRTQSGGVDAWVGFARAHGKKFSVPEWGLFVDGGGDNPFYIRKMHDFFAANADVLAYECYFNEPQDYIRSSLSGPTENPAAAAAYAALWGA